MGSGVTQAKHEVKDMKVTRSLENGEVLLKRGTKEITSQEGGLLNFIMPLMTAELRYWKMHTPSAKSVLVPLGLTEVASVVDAAIQKKIYGLGKTTLKISTKIVKSLEESRLLIKGISQTIKNEAKTQNGELTGMLLATLVANFSGNMLASKPKTTGRRVIRAGEGTIRTSEETTTAGQKF